MASVTVYFLISLFSFSAIFSTVRKKGKKKKLTAFTISLLNTLAELPLTHHFLLTDTFLYPHRSKEKDFSVMLEGEGGMEEVVGYMSTWSSLEKLRKYEGEQAAADYLARAKKR